MAFFSTLIATVSAHTVKISGDVALFHIEPEHNPRAGNHL